MIIIGTDEQPVLGAAMLSCVGCRQLEADATHARSCSRCGGQVAACQECLDGKVLLTCERCRSRPVGW